MALTATRPAIQQDSIPGLLYPSEWHREQDLEERAWLDAFIHDPSIAESLKANR